jgi:Icc protein
VLGLSRLSFRDINHPIAITDVTLDETVSSASAAGKDIVVDNFSFAPAATAVTMGSTITWINKDDVPHNIVSTDHRFKSPVLDTDEQFSHSFGAPGTYTYYCSLHPKMTGRIVVG